jgi:hypothetical protein
MIGRGSEMFAPMIIEDTLIVPLPVDFNAAHDVSMLAYFSDHAAIPWVCRAAGYLFDILR